LIHTHKCGFVIKQYNLVYSWKGNHCAWQNLVAAYCQVCYCYLRADCVLCACSGVWINCTPNDYDPVEYGTVSTCILELLNIIKLEFSSDIHLKEFTRLEADFFLTSALSVVSQSLCLVSPSSHKYCLGLLSALSVVLWSRL